LAFLEQIDQLVMVWTKPHVAMKPEEEKRRVNHCRGDAMQGANERRAQFAHILRPALAMRMYCRRVLSHENEGANRVRLLVLMPTGTSLKYGDAEERDAGVDG
jgi:hypothetical protein